MGPGHVAQSVVHLTEESEVLGFIPSPKHTFMGIDCKIFSLVVFPLPLIQEGQLSVTGESMGTEYLFSTALEV